MGSPRSQPQRSLRVSIQYSLDAKTWLSFPQVVTTKASSTLPGLTPGTRVYLRYRTTVKGVTGDWSDTISVVVE